MRPFKECEARYIIQHLVEGLTNLSENKIIHRDLKLANILVKKKPGNHSLFPSVYECQFLIADLGLARYVKAKS